MKTFWFAMLIQEAFWLLFALIEMFKLSLGWALIAFVALSLNGSNIFGYFKARFANQNDSGSYSNDGHSSLYGKMRQKVGEGLER